MADLLDSDDRSSILETFDDIFDTYKKECRVYYPSRMETCSNCIYDSIGEKSGNRYKTGGPAPFNVGYCPMCKGSGKRETENYDTVYMTIDWNPGNYSLKKFLRITDIAKIPDNVIMTRFKGSDYTKIRPCEHMIVVGAMEPYFHFKYKMFSEPIDAFQVNTAGSYFLTVWQRLG